MDTPRRPRERGLWAAGLLCAAAAVGAGISLAAGQWDNPGDPPHRPNAAAGGLALPPLSLPADFPAPAAARLLAAWEGARGARARDAAAALDGLATREALLDLRGSEAAALRALAPSLEVLVLKGRGRVPAAALGAATAVLIQGRNPAAEALRASPFLRRAAAPAAAAGPSETRRAAARLLGYAGGPDAEDRLALLLVDADPVLQEEAMRGIEAVAAGGDGILRRETPARVLALLRSREAPRNLRLQALGVLSRARRSFGDEAALAEAALLADPDAALRVRAADNLRRHPSSLAADALVAALDDADPRVVEPAATALGLLLHAPAREALERAKARATDPAAARAVEAALARLK